MGGWSKGKLRGPQTQEHKDKISESLKGKPSNNPFPNGNRLGAATKKGSDHPNWKDDVGYRNIHLWLNNNYPRSGICEKCENEKSTAYALIQGEEHDRDRSKYMELCYPCHWRYDHGS